MSLRCWAEPRPPTSTLAGWRWGMGPLRSASLPASPPLWLAIHGFYLWEFHIPERWKWIILQSCLNFFVKKEKRNPFFIQYLLYENITFYIGLRYHVTLWKSCWKIFHLKSISMNKNSKFLLKQIYSSNFTRFFFFSWHWMIVKLFLTSKYINIKEIISIYHFSDFNVKI